MKIHTTNYFDTFIEISEDCPVNTAEIPPLKLNVKTVANIQFEMIINNPYKYTSDDVLFEVFAQKNNISKSEYKTAREQFYSKGQPCFRASPLTKRYGWGVHYNKDAKIALLAAESTEYKKILKDKSLKIIKAMKSSK
jgi:hypothetical protein